MSVATIDAHAQQLLLALYATPVVDFFDVPPEMPPAEGDILEQAKAAAALLVAAKFAKYADDGRTQLTITNAGRYWANHGGYFAFLREEPPSGSGGRNRNPEFETMRMTFMRLRLSTFWWGFGMSVASFIFSLLSLGVALYFGDRLFR